MSRIDESMHPFLTDISANSHIIPPDKSNRIEKTKTYDVVVDSRERDTNLYPNPNSYEIKFLEPFQDVISVEVVSVNVPFANPQPSLNKNYVVMKIAGMDIYRSNSRTLNKATTIVYEDWDTNNPSGAQTKIKHFNPPKPNFDFRVKFFDFGGQLYDFGTNKEHSIHLRITVLKTGRRL